MWERVVSCACLLVWCICFFKQKTAYEMRISDWSSDVGSSDLDQRIADAAAGFGKAETEHAKLAELREDGAVSVRDGGRARHEAIVRQGVGQKVLDRVDNLPLFGRDFHVDHGRGARGKPSTRSAMKIGRAHVWTPVTNAHLVCRLLLETKKTN